jgi:hypothetical protein
MLFRAVFWVVLLFKMIVDRRFRGTYCLQHPGLMNGTSVENLFTRQYNPEDSSEHHTRRRENLKSHTVIIHVCQQSTVQFVRRAIFWKS